MAAVIHYFTEDVKFLLKEKKQIAQWLVSVAKAEQYEIVSLNIIFCSDKYLLELNQSYLEHDDFTDVITFDYTENRKITGEIYISAERIAENAAQFKVSTRMEALRVMVHGLLHLCGYTDYKTEEKKRMTQKEDFYLAQFSEKD